MSQFSYPTLLKIKVLQYKNILYSNAIEKLTILGFLKNHLVKGS